MKLELKNVTKWYGRQCVLDQISMVLEPGLYGLLGENGAGKTTLMNIIVGLLPMSSGVVLWEGRPMEEWKNQYYNMLGFMPQYPKFYKNFTAKEFLEYMCHIKGVPRKKRKEQIQTMLQMVNLESDSKKLIGAYSGGMRQRLGIAQAMLNNPKLLVLDEPTAGLDPRERVRFRNLITELSKGRIIILATHIVVDVELAAKEIILIQQGKLIKKDKPEIMKPLIHEIFSME